MRLAMGLTIAAAVLWAAAGGARAHEQHEGAASAPAPAAETTPFPADIGGPFALVDHRGRAVTDASYRGRFMLIFFGYSQCEAICPVGLKNMTAAVTLLGDAGASVQPLLITVDPEADSPEVLARAVPEIHPRLVGLTGSPEALAAARKAYKVEAKPTGRSWKGKPLISHGSFVYLVGPDGALLAILPPVLAPEAMADILRRYVI